MLRVWTRTAGRDAAAPSGEVATSIAFELLAGRSRCAFGNDEEGGSGQEERSMR